MKLTHRDIYNNDINARVRYRRVLLQRYVLYFVLFVVVVAQDVFLLPIHVSPSKKNPNTIHKLARPQSFG